MDSTPVQHTVADVKTFRQDVDALITRLETQFQLSRELALVKTKLEEAKMWAGKEFANLGVPQQPEPTTTNTQEN